MKMNTAPGIRTSQPASSACAEEPTRPACAAEAAPLSFSQRRLWFLDQMQPGNPVYNLGCVIRLKGALHRAALARALDAIVQRHESLRTTFAAGPSQVIASRWTFELPLIDLRPTAADLREQELQRLARDEAKRPFDLSRDLMLRARLFKLDDQDHALLLVLHHIAADGWSMAILYRELSAFYEAGRKGAELLLPELPIQYADYAAWQQEQSLDGAAREHLDYWKNQLAGAPPLLELPSDRPRPPVPSYRGAIETVEFPAPLIGALKDLCREKNTTLFMALLAAFKALVHRYTGREDIVIGSPVAGRDRLETQNLIGFFVNMVVFRSDLAGDPTFTELLARVRDVALAAYDHRDVPFEKLVEELHPKRNLSHGPLCQVVFALQNMPSAALALPGLEASVEMVDTGTARFDLTLSATERSGALSVSAEYCLDLFSGESIRRLLGNFRALLEGVVANPEQPISQLPILTDLEKSELTAWNATEVEYVNDSTVHHLFEAQVARTPDAIAAVFEDEELTYRELNEKADRLASELRGRGAGPDVLVALCMERSLEMMVGLLGILKSGSAYLPLDPLYPKDRLAFMLEDSRAPLLLSQHRLQSSLPAAGAKVVWIEDVLASANVPVDAAVSASDSHRAEAGPDNLAYVLYTSGSTGKPKGVMVTHRNVLNFFAGMDPIMGAQPGVWLALTSISFDISVLELFWTLVRGFKVVILSDQARLLRSEGAGTDDAPAKPIDFGLFYFATEDEKSAANDKYRLLIEGAKFADQHGFRAIWTPERHFHSFGGLYPNPAVTSAALATITRQIQIRAGSVVLPLHHPLRVAEEWSVVDNLSKGRIGLSVASGWHDRDFALAPGNYAARKDVMWQSLETLRKLWRGEAIDVLGGSGTPASVKIFPQPIQKELPVWITAAGTPDTFRLAGEAGANVLTHLLGQNLDELAQKIQLYRTARRERGLDDGCVTLALHTFIGDDLEAVREKVKGPFCDYLIKSLDLLKGLTQGYSVGDLKKLAPDELRAVAEHAFNRYFDGSGLLGTPESCLPLLERLENMGVNEVACLIDFGVDADAVLKSLEGLARLRDKHVRRKAAEAPRFSLIRQIQRHGVTHLQCTPSFARMLAQSPEALAAIRPLHRLIVGGEAFSAELAEPLCQAVQGEVHNLYGPTETTVWSTSSRVEPVKHGGIVPIGRPIANTSILILDAHRQPTPVGVPGELCIGGDGVARGYLHRPELTAERFIEVSFAPGQRFYRTGDLARYRPGGVIEFLGRIDQQVKLRGHRIELGEIEAVLSQHPAVKQSAVVVRGALGEDPRLAAYVVLRPGVSLSATELKKHLKQQLPEHMVPAAFALLEQLPLTPNGKVDRKALPDLEWQREGGVRFAPPRTPMEQELARIWSDLLRVPEVGRDDNFFELGGHSLLATQLVSRLRTAFSLEVPVRILFESPTIAEQARFLAALRRPVSPLNEVPIVTAAERVAAGELLAKLDGLSDEEIESMLAAHTERT
jgi:natural product biosynthesis luciferase-like monooxygenase protein